MPLVKVKQKHQITLPTIIREETGLSVGDWIDVKIEKGKVVLTPKSVIDRHIAEAMIDISEGRVYGPFSSAKDLTRSLRGGLKNRKA